MTLESALPYLALAAAGGAGWATMERPGSTWERGLKAAALGALAAFAYWRGLAPGALGIALLLSAAGQFLPPREPAEWGSRSSFLLFGAWAAFAFLFLKEAGDAARFIAEPVRLLAPIAAVAASVLLVWRLREPMGRAWFAASVDLAILSLMVGAAALLERGAWPALAGAGAVFVAEAANLHRAFIPPARPGGVAPAAIWGLNFLGQAAMAYVFLR